MCTMLYILYQFDISTLYYIAYSKKKKKTLYYIIIIHKN